MWCDVPPIRRAVEVLRPKVPSAIEAQAKAQIATEAQRFADAGMSLWQSFQRRKRTLAADGVLWVEVSSAEISGQKTKGSKMRNMVLVFGMGMISGLGLVACGSPAVRTALDLVTSPAVVDAVTWLVRDRWGSDAEVDVDTVACAESPKSCAFEFGDDYEEFVYLTCRGKAVE